MSLKETNKSASRKSIGEAFSIASGKPVSADIQSAPDRPEGLELLPTTSEIKLDVDAYMHDLGDLDISDAQKRALIETLWPIARSFVELGFSPDTCGQLWGRFAAGNKGIPGAGKIIEATKNVSRRLPGPDEGKMP
jgi:hypothetical protein